MSNGLGNPSFARAPTESTPQWTNTTVPGRADRGIRLRRIHHEIPDEAIRVPPNRRADRAGIAGHARNQRRARHTGGIELGNPPIRQLLGRPRRIPAKPRERRVAAERGEERC